MRRIQLLSRAIFVSLIVTSGCAKPLDSSASPTSDWTETSRLAEASDSKELEVRCLKLMDKSDFDFPNVATSTDSQAGTVSAFVFVATKCPIANRFAPEIKRIQTECKKNGQQLFVVYPDPSAELSDLEKHANDYGFLEFAVWDQHLDLANHLSAGYTPEAIVVIGSYEDPANVVYRGRINDWYVDFGKAKASAEVHDLRDALRMAAANQKLERRETKVIGCPIPRLGDSH